MMITGRVCVSRQSIPFMITTKSLSSIMLLSEILRGDLPFKVHSSSTSSRSPNSLTYFLMTSHTHLPDLNSTLYPPCLAIIHDVNLLERVRGAGNDHLIFDNPIDNLDLSPWLDDKSRHRAISAGWEFASTVGDVERGILFHDEIGMQGYLLIFIYHLIQTILSCRKRLSRSKLWIS